MNSTKHNYIYNLIFTIVNLIFPILTFPYAARMLGPVGIGKIQFIISFAQYFALVAALGIPVYGIREIAKTQNDKENLSKTFSELVIIYVLTSALSSIIYIIIVSSIGMFKPDINAYYAAGGIVLLGFCSIDWFYAGVEEFKLIALRSVFVKIVAIILLYAFVKTAHDVYVYLLISIFALIGNNIISILLVWSRVKIVLRDLNFKRHFKPLIFIFSTTLASSMYTLLDVVMLGFLSNDRSVGYYSAGVKLAKVTIPFVTSLGAVVIPKISFSVNNKDFNSFYKILGKSFDFIIFISVPIAFGLFFLSKETVILFSGAEFTSAIPVMQVLSILPFVIGLGFFFGIQILIPASKDKEMLKSVSIGMAVSLSLNFLLIPYLKEVGAAYANVISEVFVTLSYIYFVRKSFQFKIEYHLIIKAIISSILFIPIIYLTERLIQQNLIIVIVSVILCAITYALMQFYIFKNQISLNIYQFLIKRLKITQ
ncbi:flippase [Mucilaginibacter sp. OK283]|uniref:flippase n=1 Tax=Mucilaginibacter sp. OK283 TaxID=1881049 RepID=UPI0008CA39E7|nr:flippase [Mucilaginibacter sp. OK283]SEO12049.1 Membrane protein involved in the export of O-antigen and teichoic acid [Mucilaginibacter sp. OK283]